MITLYSGTPGSGKSLDMANDIRMALNKPRGEDMPVIANFPVNVQGVRRPQAFHYVPNSELTPGYLTDFAEDFWDTTSRRFSEDYLLLALDELQLLHNSRNWMTKGRNGKHDSRMDWLEFFSQHRKYGYRIIFAAQSAKMIDNQFRMLIETEVNHRKVAHMGLVGGIVSKLFLDRLFFRVKYLYQTNERLGMSFMLARKCNMTMYDSYTKLRQVTA